jgi:hypothetical protein
MSWNLTRGERGGISTTTLRLDGPGAGGGDGGGARLWEGLRCWVGGVGARVGRGGGGVIDGDRVWGALPCRAGGGVAALVGRVAGGGCEGDGARGVTTRAAGGGVAILNLAFSVRRPLGARGGGTVGIGVEVEAGRGGGDCRSSSNFLRMASWASTKLGSFLFLFQPRTNK